MPERCLDLILTALEDQGVIRRLAEPNLIASSGQSADFLAGGEFPVPVSASTTNGFPTTTIEFKEFGVGLSFTPTVLAGGTLVIGALVANEAAGWRRRG